jgi:hypothetical protein
MELTGRDLGGVGAEQSMEEKGERFGVECKWNKNDFPTE